MKTYCLYLDESGDFDKDLEIEWKNECLVGGFLVEKNKNFSHTEAKKIIADAYRTIHPEDAKIHDDEAFLKIQHATELTENKARLCAEVLTGMEKKTEFIIFENYKKSKIISSSQTYLNILVDGIIQLLSRLIMDNSGDAVSIEVLAGRRVNTAGEEYVRSNRMYIADEEYIKRINERLLLERIKRPMIFNSRSQVSFVSGDDKKDHFLVPCDYICNFYLTRTSAVYQEEYQEGITYSQFLLGLYQDKNLFQLNGSLEQERVLNYVENQTYDAALFDICTGRIQGKENRSRILEHIKKLREKQVQNILAGLSSYMNNVVDVARDIDASIEYLKNAEAIIEELSKEHFHVELYDLDIKLYELAVYNHRGELQEMESLFEECQKILKKILSHAENIEYAFMFYNRYAVYLYDVFEFEKGFELLEKVKKSFEAYELILSEFPNLDLEEGFHATQLGKILGTQVQYCRYMVKQGLLNYEEAVDISEKAIENFELEAERKRQYQYRMQLEAEAGHYEEAMEFFQKGWGVNKWEDIFQEQNISPFGMYHFSFLMERYGREESLRKEIVKKMIKKCRDNEEKIFSYKEFPGFLICANIAKTMVHMEMDAALIQKYYRQALSVERQEEFHPLFALFSLMIHADYVGWLLNHGKDAEKEIRTMTEVLAKVSEKELKGNIKTICKQLNNILMTREAEKYIHFSEILQY